jgi:HSP20 family molecular chaperone IbpA
MTVTPYHLDRVIDNFFSAGMNTTIQKTQYTQTSNETAYTISAPMIGVSKADLTVNVVGSNLVVNAIPSVKSRWSTEFKQTWILNEDADVNNINAKLDNGLLTLTIPRIKPATRTVNINVQ